MKTLNQYIKEKLIINKDYREAKIVVKSFDELRKIIDNRYKKLGPGTKQNPIDFNDIDVSKIDSFYSSNIDKGIFSHTDFKYIDISEWDVSKVKSTCSMFYLCEKLESVGDISKWDVSKLTSRSFMFCDCCSFNQNISGWDVSSVTDMTCMFDRCKSFNQDISNWNVSNVRYKNFMFNYCPIKDEYKPKFK